MKATTNPMIREDGLHYSLKRKNYEDLRIDRAIPLILVIVELPKPDSEWITISENELVLRKRAWWTSLKGQDPIQGDSKTVVIPESQCLDVNVLIELMARSREGMLS